MTRNLQMENQVVDKKFTWVIKNFSSLDCEKIYSDPFIKGGCKWCLSVYPKGEITDEHLSLYLRVADHKSLPSGWRRHAKFSLTVVDQLFENLSQKAEEVQHWFCEKSPSWGFLDMLPLTDLHKKYSGFLEDGELKITAEIVVLEVIGKLDDTEDSEEIVQPMKKMKQENDGVFANDLLNKNRELKESFEINRFLVRPSQLESVKLIYESHPDFASGVRTKSPHLRTTYINVLLGLIETLCQSPQELSEDDLKEASVTLSYAVNIGFKLDWLEKKLHQVLEKKNKVESGEARLPEMEKEVQNLSKKYSDLKALLEKEKAEVADAKTPLSFDDFL